jgi:hypothetical protein
MQLHSIYPLIHGNTTTTHYMFTDNQAGEHIATQPNMNEQSRSIDIRHRIIRQDYLERKVKVGGVNTKDNNSDVLIKFLTPQLHIAHTTHLNLQQDPNDQ